MIDQPQHTWARVTSGPIFDACQKWWARKEAAEAKAKEIAVEIGANPKHTLRRGAWLEGFLRPSITGDHPKGWRPAGKQFPHFIKPNTRSETGKAFKARMDAIQLETAESLASELKLPPFFGGFCQGFCSAVGCFMHGGVFYLEYPVLLSQYFHGREGVEDLAEWEYIKARDAK